MCNKEADDEREMSAKSTVPFQLTMPPLSSLTAARGTVAHNVPTHVSYVLQK